MTAEWRPDPLQRAQWRYHDGTNWTRHIATNGAQTTESSDLPLPEAAAPAPDPATLVTAPAPSPYPMPMAYPAAPALPAWVTAPRRKGGRLIAAGVLGIISGVLGFLASIGYFVLLSLPNCANAAAGENCTNVVVNDSAPIKALMGISIAFTVVLFVAGIGGCMRRYWGQRLLVIVGAVQIVFDLIAIGVRTNPSSLVNIGFCAVLIGLARANDRSEYEIPRNL